jgi:hypothetical protein
MRSIGIPELLIVLPILVIGLIILTVIPYWFILRKAGHPPALSLLMLIPLVNIVLLFWLAFGDWPALRAPARPAPGFCPNCGKPVA